MDDVLCQMDSLILNEGENLRDRCRFVAKKYFSLDGAVDKYEKNFNELIGWYGIINCYN